MYPPELKNFALSLHFYSSKAYDFVRSQFSNCLPHPKTLSRWYSCTNGNPGFQNDVFDVLKNMASNRQGSPLLCTMMLDEVAIRRQLDWDGKKFVGYVDLGVPVEDGSSLPIAKEALVFMIVSLTERWKIPLSYFLIDGLQGAERANLVQICLHKLYAVGVRVVSLTFDGCSANYSMASHLGAKLEANEPVLCFPHPADPSENIHIFLDACHMVKLMRNMLADKRVLLDGRGMEIKWEYIVQLEKLQSSEGLRAGNKLTERHVQWEQQKMKVKLAVQTLSASVADALVFCEQVLKLPEFRGCTATVNFIRIVDRLFDFLNSRNPIAHGFKAPMRKTNEPVWRPFINEACQYLCSLKLPNGQLVSSSLRKTAVVGLIVSSLSAVSVFDNLVVQQSLLKYILTYKMSQDHLELFFSAVRSRGGWNNNPSAVHFKAAWKRLLTHQQIREVTSGNCTPQADCPILAISASIRDHERVDVMSAAELRLKDTMRDLCDVPATDSSISQMATFDFGNLSDFSQNVIAYIAGFVVRSLHKRLTCNECSAVLTSAKSTVNESEAGCSLIKTKDRGGLLQPSDDVVKLCKLSESQFRSLMAPGQRPVVATGLKQTLINSVLRSCIGLDLFEDLTEHTFNSDPVDDHRVLLMKKVVEQYIVCRLHHQAKCFSRAIHTHNRRSKLTKTVLFYGQ